MISAPAGFARVRRFSQYLSDLWHRREFAWYLGMGNLKARNASTVLGLAWWVLNPLLLGGVYYLVFGLLFFSDNRPDNFLAYLLSGIFVFHYTSQALTGGANSILQNSKLLVNLRFPRLILPLANLLESTVGFLASLVVFYIITLPTGGSSLTFRLIYLIPLVLIHVFFNLGLSAIAARLAVPFRDINNLIPYLSRIWMYLSPILWPLSFLETADPAIARAIQLNPMFHILAVYRQVLLGTPIHAADVLWVVVSALVVGVFGIVVFVRYEGHIVRYL
jgi:teichoic acid transport system permease protein